MKKAAKIVLIVLGVIISVFIIAYIVLGMLFGFELLTWQNVKAAIKGLTTSEEQLLEEQKKHTQEQVNVLIDNGMYASPEFLEMMASSGLGMDEITEILRKGPLAFLANRGAQAALAALEQDDGTDTNLDGTEIPPPEDVTQPEQQSPTQDGEDVTTQNPEAEKDEPDGKETQTDQEKQPDKTEDKTDIKPEVKPEVKPDDKTDTSKPQDSVKDGKDGKGSSDTKTDVTKPVDKPPQTDSGNDGYVDDRIAEVIAQMYVYKAEYSGSISGIVSAMSNEFYKLPAEQQTYSNKVSIYNNYSGQIASLEAQCDAQVYALIDELRTLLRENGRDTALADSLASAYETEKENTKAYYVNRYAN